MKCKLIEDTKQTRIDRLVWNKEFSTLPPDQWVANQLKDIRIVHNSAFLVEMKDEQDLEDDTEMAQGKASYEPTVVDLDDTESDRTVIATVGDGEVQRYQVNLEWSLQRLLEFLIEKLTLEGYKFEGPHRLRRLLDNKSFCAEEMGSKLKNYEAFREGGTRIQVEEGRPTTMAEISINVVLHKKEEDRRQFYFSADLPL